MASTEIKESGVSANGAAPVRLKVLFLLRSTAYVVVFESLLRAMLARGHEVRVALDPQAGGLPEEDVRLLDALRERFSGFGYEQLPRRKDLWRIPASAIRRGLDYLRYLERDDPEEDPARHRARDQAPRALRALLFVRPFRRPVGWLLRRLEAGMPIPGSVRSLVKDQAPDVTIVSPLVESGSAQGDYVRTAEAAKVPTVLVVASSDDLTSKGVIRDLPTLTVVSDETQVEEAVRLHDLPRERIEAVGAESSNGVDSPLGAEAVKAIERAASTDVVPRRAGRFLEPLLWLLTPLLALVLPFLRPRATVRAVVKAVRRLGGRIRKRARTLRRTIRHKRAARARRRAARRKARIAAAKEQKLTAAEPAKEQKQTRAEAKRQKLASAAVARGQVKPGAEAAEKQRDAEAARTEDQEPAEAAEETVNPRK